MAEAAKERRRNEGTAAVVAVEVEEVEGEVAMEGEEGPRTQSGGETTGEGRSGGGDHGDVRGDVHGDDVHAYVNVYDSPQGYVSHPSGRLHHPVG